MPRHVLEFGPTVDDMKTGRKMRVVNIAALIAAVGFGLTAIYQFQLGPDWRYLACVNLGLGVAVLLTLALDRFGLEIKVAYITVWLFVFLAHDLSWGKNGDDHLLLLVGPPLLFYFLGSAYWRWITAVTVFSAILFIYVSLFVPLHVPPGDTVWDLRHLPLDKGLTQRPQDVLFMVLIFGIVSALYFTSYSANVAVERYEEALEREFAVSEQLLDALLPHRIVERIKTHPGQLIADRYESATILFADLSGFSEFAADNGARATVSLLDQVFSEFDKLVAKHGLEKIKTIGDSYMVAGGLDPSAPDTDAHPVRMALLGLDMVAAVARVSENLDPKVSLRVGIHQGPVIAGVIGGDRPFFDVWGNTVNIASRMESNGEPGRVQITPQLAKTIKPHFQCKERGPVWVKGKGLITPCWLGSPRENG